jgi:hypothetical protein
MPSSRCRSRRRLANRREAGKSSIAQERPELAGGRL